MDEIARCIDTQRPGDMGAFLGEMDWRRELHHLLFDYSDDAVRRQYALGFNNLSPGSVLPGDAAFSKTNEHDPAST